MKEDSKVGTLEAALDLLRRLPPQKIEENVHSLAQLLPTQANDLLSTVDIPAKIRVCPISSREYLLCDYNRDGNSYRSPWSNEYDPPLDDMADGWKPSERLRKLEVVANEAFATYRTLYYEGGVSSVYVWDDIPAEDENVNERFMAAVLIKKESEGTEILRSGAWDAMHVFEISVNQDKNTDSSTDHAPSATYNLTTTITLHLDTAIDNLDKFLLAGHVTRQSRQSITLLTPDTIEKHIPIMGRMVEEMESRMRSSLQEIYFGKIHDVVNEIRPVMPAGYLRHQADLQREMLGRLNLKKTSKPEMSAEATVNKHNNNEGDIKEDITPERS